jgi:hypothetical protein
MPATERAGVEKCAAEVKNRYGEAWWKQAERRGQWDGKSIYAMAKLAGLEDLYSKVYKFSCEPTHAADFTEHAGVSSDSSLIVSLGPEDSWVDAVLPLSRNIFREIEISISQVLKLGKEIGFYELEK